MSLSGAALVLAPRVDRLLHPELWRAADPAGERLAPSALLASVAQRHPDRRTETLIFDGDPRRSVVAEVAGGLQVFLDPRTGAVLGERWRDETLPGRLEALHTTLLAGGPGRAIVGACTVVLVALIPLGLWLWWPATRRALRGALTLRLGRGWKRANYDLHSVVGFYGSLVLLLVAATGVIAAYPALRELGARVVARIVALERPPGAEATGDAARVRGEVGDVGEQPTRDFEAVLDQVVARVAREVPDAAMTRVSLPPRDGERPFRIVARAPDAAHPGALDLLLFEQATGAPRRIDRYAELPTVVKLDRLVGQIHVGTVFGWPSEVVVFVASLIGGALPITGALIWYPRWRRRRRPRSDA